MSFLVIARKYIHTKNPYFAKCVAVTLNWMELSKDDVPIELASEFKDFFSGFEIDSKVQSEQNLRTLFKICRQVHGDVKWIQ